MIIRKTFKDSHIGISPGLPLIFELLRGWLKRERELLIGLLYGLYDRATGSNASPASFMKLIWTADLWHIIALFAGRRLRDLIIRLRHPHTWGVRQRRHRLWWGHTYIRFGFKTSTAHKKDVEIWTDFIRLIRKAIRHQNDFKEPHTWLIPCVVTCKKEKTQRSLCVRAQCGNTTRRGQGRTASQMLTYTERAGLTVTKHVLIRSQVLLLLFIRSET